jgi:hypothetical protein
MRNATIGTTFGPRVIALVLAAVTAASMVLTGCGVGKKKAVGPPGAKDWNAYNTEYLAEQKKLTLPLYVSWPSKAPAPPTYQGAPQTFEDGVGRGQADSYWYCAWERRWLSDLSGRPAAAKQDLRQLMKLKGTSFYQANAPSDRHIYTDAWARAQLGDPSLIQRDVTANCAGVGIPKAT